MKEHWDLEEGVLHLNHGSFGACPRAVLRYQQSLRQELESNTTGFMVRRLPALLAEAKEKLSQFVGVDAKDLAFVPNTTTGVNAVVRSLSLEPGDEIVVTDHGYSACSNAASYVAGKQGAKVVVAKIPHPIETEQQAFEAVTRVVSERTKLVIVDHITSPTALILPIAKLAEWLTGKGVKLLADGAHAPGMIALNIKELGVDYYVANCHKWLCAPKGSAFLWAHAENQEELYPTSISLGYSKQLPGQSKFQARFDWNGTDDPTAFLAVPEAIKVVGEMMEGGWPSIYKRNSKLAASAQKILIDSMGVQASCPTKMNGSMVAFPWPQGGLEKLSEHGIETPPKFGPGGEQVLRLSAHLYNQAHDYERLVDVLKKI